MTQAASPRLPSLWQGVRWALQPGAGGGGTSRARLVLRVLRATLLHGKTLRRWMAFVHELQARDIVRDVAGEYLRALRPHVHRGTGFVERIAQLIDNVDWLETALQPVAFEALVGGQPLVLAELDAPRGYDFMRIQLRRAGVQSPEGEWLLTLSLRRSADVQRKAPSVDVAVLAFSRFRIEGLSCLAIGGVRGQRHPVQRVSAMEIRQALQGWKPAVLLVRVAQELARYWGLHLVGLNPASHRLQGWSYQWNARYRAMSRRIFASYDALWEYFESSRGPRGWMVLPLNSDAKLAATALSPEKRVRQIRRADYWMRTRHLLRQRCRVLLLRPDREARLSGVTQDVERDSLARPDEPVYV